MSEELERALSLLKTRAVYAGYHWPSMQFHFGGCVEDNHRFRAQAHAHCLPKDKRFGWVCVLSSKESRLVTPTGRPTTLLAHEVAHMITKQGHSEKWRNCITQLGFPAEAARYRTGVERK